MEGQLTKSIIIGSEVSDLYRFCTNAESLSRFLKKVQSVKRTGDRTIHWVAKGSRGKHLEWDTEITRLEEDKRIAWHSKRGGDIKTSGQITFNPMPKHQTEVTVVFKYLVPNGKGPRSTKKAEKTLLQDLRGLKSYAERRVRERPTETHSG